jgi:hypothetical protein
MTEFLSTENKKLMLDVDQQGVTFAHLKADGKAGDLFQIGQNWSSVRSLLSKLRNKQRYSAKDNSLSAWMQGDEMSIKFRALDMQLEETLTFSSETTTQILRTLESSPNTN